MSKTLKTREKIERDLLLFATSRDGICKFCKQREIQFFNKLVMTSIFIICWYSLLLSTVTLFWFYVLCSIKFVFRYVDLQDYSNALKSVAYSVKDVSKIMKNSNTHTHTPIERCFVTFCPFSVPPPFVLILGLFQVNPQWSFYTPSNHVFLKCPICLSAIT